MPKTSAPCTLHAHTRLQVNFEGDTVWHVVVQRDQMEALKQLLQVVEQTAENTEAVKAICRGMGLPAERLPATAAELAHLLVNIPNHSGETPLHQACLLGRHHMVAVLAANVRSVGSGGSFMRGLR